VVDQAPLRRRLLAEGLTRRARDVARFTTPGPAQNAASNQPASDREEALRIAMVRLVPAARHSGSHATEESDELLAAVLALEEAAADSDLRFLDAWNVAYETVVVGMGNARRGSRVTAFLVAYERLLSAHIQRLGDVDA